MTSILHNTITIVPGVMNQIHKFFFIVRPVRCNYTAASLERIPKTVPTCSDCVKYLVDLSDILNACSGDCMWDYEKHQCIEKGNVDSF